jgi:hypothetical protein
MCAVLHSVLKYVFSFGFRANGAFCFGLINANVRYWEAKVGVGYGLVWVRRKEGGFWGLDISIPYADVDKMLAPQTVRGYLMR